MQIQNGKIYIARGEESTFRAKLYMGDGTPFRLLKQSAAHEIENFWFTIKRNPYKRDDVEQTDYVIRYQLKVYDDSVTGSANLPLLNTMDVVALSTQPTANTSGTFSPGAADVGKVTTNCLYAFTGSSGVTTYYYRVTPDADDKTLGIYVCDIMFVIPTSDTKNLTEDTYYYALDWESIVRTNDGRESRKKVPLILPSEFIIGGSIYD